MFWCCGGSSPEEIEMQGLIKSFQTKRTVKRRKQGFFKTGHQEISLRLNNSKDAIIYNPDFREKGSSEKNKTYQINIIDIKNISLNDGSFRIFGKTGDLLLDCDTSSSSDKSYFGDLSDVLSNLMNCTASRSSKDESVVDKKNSISSDMKAKAEKQLYFAKKEQEMRAKAKKAKARKDQFIKEAGGLKYTAIAMAKS